MIWNYYLLTLVWGIKLILRKLILNPSRKFEQMGKIENYLNMLTRIFNAKVSGLMTIIQVVGSRWFLFPKIGIFSHFALLTLWLINDFTSLTRQRDFV